MDTTNILSRHLEELMSFHSVATSGSFTQAAQHQSQSKGYLSKQVQRLEAVLGLQLLERTTRRVRPTESGRLLLRHTESILHSTREAAALLEELKTGEEGKVRITAPISIGKWCFPELAKFIQQEFPKLSIDTNLSNDPIDFREDDVDFAIRAMEVKDLNLIARYLGKLRDVIVCSPGYLKKKKLRDPRQLENEPCILSSLEEEWNVWTLVSDREEIRVEVRGKLASNEYSAALDLTLAGLGIARLPHHVVSKCLAEGTLVQLFPQYAIGTHPMYLVYRKGNFRTKHQKAIRDWLLNWFNQNPEAFI